MSLMNLLAATPLINSTLYYILCGALTLGVLIGIFLMSKVKLSVIGNRVSAVCMLLGIVLTLVKNEILSVWALYIALAIGIIIGLIMAIKVKMIQMPQMVALLNGLGGAASAIVGAFAMYAIGSGTDLFSRITSIIALSVGALTLVGSLVAAGKLHKILPQKPVVYKGHQIYTVGTLILILAGIIVFAVLPYSTTVAIILLIAETIISCLFGYFFAIRVGGADMPITISLLNSLSGVAGAIAGLAISDLLLVAVGGIVGASGLLLTQIMCKSMNRKLMDILLSKSSAKSNNIVEKNKSVEVKTESVANEDPIEILNNAKDVIIVPGYGMAIAQAQHLVKNLADYLTEKGCRVRYAVHPVAGRMPGHMNVLLCEANVDYEDLYEMDVINPDFVKADAAIVVGANDVLNPAAREAEGTPIYGMPVLDVDKCKNIYIFNYDSKPGYAGVDNPIYSRKNGVYKYFGNAAETLSNLLNDLKNGKKSETKAVEKAIVGNNPIEILSNAKDVIIVPGYGMAIAQAQHLVKNLADYLTEKGCRVRYAVHPVAGRMPGHMNVLLCEANVDYEDLYEMDVINPDFEKADAAIVVGANDVLNPAAREAEGTPIYGMPVLDVDKCKNIYIFNYDSKPGYAGVDNPIYSRKNGVYKYFGNAAETLSNLLNDLKNGKKSETKAVEKAIVGNNPIEILSNAKDVIIVPGYGMAIAQAQHLVKNLADLLVSRGCRVRYAVHPVAGRMPGHMNVLLCEANVDYEDLYEMDVINPDFVKADAAIVVGANDVLNPAAREAEGTPIYGMPVLDVDKCKNIFIFNYDTKPGYAGVDNPIYTRKDGVYLYLGNAAETLSEVINSIKNPSASVKNPLPINNENNPVEIIKNAKDVIIVPGYGMAIAQAQHLVKNLADLLVSRGCKVRYAVHPVAGRMPGHMNVLLCEANVDYEDLYEMDVINQDFIKADATIVVGANDVLNPAAREAEGTPIYGMPVLDVDKCKNIFIFNYDTKPGYAGVDNPIYTRKDGVYLYLGNAAETLSEVINSIKNPSASVKNPLPINNENNPVEIIKNAKDVIIVPGYGMAIAQAQHLVKNLADLLVSRGCRVRYAVHPVAGRMPGHMNVLLCEANVDYEDLYEMDVINPDFVKADAAIVVGANDVLNPAAREAEGTPIYGMPVLDVDKCKNIYIFNYDTKPGYAGVDNPIYTRKDGVYLYLGDAAEKLSEFINSIK